MPWEEGPGSSVELCGPVLQLELRFADGQLGFWDRGTARYLELPEEESERLRQARAESEARVLEARIAEVEAASRASRDPLG